MPFISFTTNHKLTLRQENEIASKTGELISIIPGKTEQNLMLHLEDDQILYFGGQDVTCMMIDVKLFHEAELSAKEEFTEKLTKMIEETTNIPVNHIYVAFSEFDHWGKQGKLQ